MDHLANFNSVARHALIYFVGDKPQVMRQQNCILQFATTCLSLPQVDNEIDIAIPSATLGNARSDRYSTSPQLHRHPKHFSWWKALGLSIHGQRQGMSFLPNIKLAKILHDIISAVQVFHSIFRYEASGMT